MEALNSLILKYRQAKEVESHLSLGTWQNTPIAEMNISDIELTLINLKKLQGLGIAQASARHVDL